MKCTPPDAMPEDRAQYHVASARGTIHASGRWQAGEVSVAMRATMLVAAHIAIVRKMAARVKPFPQSSEPGKSDEGRGGAEWESIAYSTVGANGRRAAMGRAIICPTPTGPRVEGMLLPRVASTYGDLTPVYFLATQLTRLFALTALTPNNFYSHTAIRGGDKKCEA